MRPILFHVGPIAIYSYGLLLVIGFLSALYVIKKNAHTDPQILDSLAFWLILVGIAGARILHVLLNIHTYIQNPISAFAIHRGGLVFYGGLAGAVIAGALFCRVKKIKFWEISDEVALGIPVGTFFGRIGCFLNGCCYGRQTGVLWGVKHPTLDHIVHPVQLYEALLLLLIFFIILKLKFLWKGRMQGDIFLVYVILYSAARIFMEFFRGDHPETISGIFQISMIFIIISFGMFIAYRYATRK
jgi:phosphatidylglycerol:prolipoprotein diacylglycerol transferase